MQALPQKIRKRDDSLASFDDRKIWRAIFRAALEVLEDELKAREIAASAVSKVLEKISVLYADRIPSVENIQDMVEESLMEDGDTAVARS